MRPGDPESNIKRKQILIKFRYFSEGSLSYKNIVNRKFRNTCQTVYRLTTDCHSRSERIGRSPLESIVGDWRVQSTKTEPYVTKGAQRSWELQRETRGSGKSKSVSKRISK